MKIAVISDTHLREPDSRLTEIFNEHLADADLLIHCGDLVSFSVWQFFCQHPNFYAALGNCDDWKLSDQLRPLESLSFQGLRIGIAHGWGNRSQVSRNVANSFSPDFDLLCYGHTHIQDWSVVNGIQMLNPGSLTSPRDNKPPSVAILEVAENMNLFCSFIPVD
ncbi:YfcE family phosphodiesterase [Maridesulfovibrio ferrireducens]|uniref:YfcE family phosphodiesterase n=1 Tax=Maridesulfovibrio ferrireducens TaxID=246191 RepID=UPI001A2A2885|nr:YfcE family phosphodiesterase [Maridesulfovibrio ferrireducens]MBI9112066.1 YfcE family phosphodiesterase [Maridesulfovibrio ferrireducens]